VLLVHEASDPRRKKDDMKYHRRGLMPHHPQEPSEVDGPLAELADTTGRDLKRAGIPRASARTARIVDRLGLVDVVFARIGGESPTLTKPMLRKALAVALDVDRQAPGVMRRASRGDRNAIVQLLADTVLNISASSATGQSPSPSV
jgi:hypothetical protein